VLDVEWNPHSPTCTRRPDPATVRSEIGVFLDIVGRHYGQRPIIYTTIAFWEDNGFDRISGEEFWLRATAGHPSDVYPGASWTFWQYSGTGRVPGIAGPVDLNAFAGSEGTWRNWLQRRTQQGLPEIP
jgi:lysozyme